MPAIYPDLADRSVLVTGGATGIGAAITTAFARQRCRVSFIDIQRDAGQALVASLAGAGLQAGFVEADLTDIAQLRAAVVKVRERQGPITVLINNAARDDRHATEDVTPEYFDERIALNLKHSFFASQAVLPDMKTAGGGAIVNFSSIAWMTGAGGMAIYTAAKSAMIGLTRSLARDYGAYGVRVNAVAPGWIRTERQVEKWITPAAEAQLMQAQCLKRWLLPEDVARFVVFLASDEAGGCTAQHYVVDGGRT